jgi:hypothetical protein
MFSSRSVYVLEPLHLGRETGGVIAAKPVEFERHEPSAPHAGGRARSLPAGGSPKPPRDADCS